jgi:TonB family protein
MFEQSKFAPRRISSAAVAFSAGVHMLALCALLYRPEPRLLQPESSLRGEGGSGRNSVALIAPGFSAAPTPKNAELRKQQAILARRQKSRPTPQAQAAALDKPLKPGMPGFILGSLSSGLPSDHDVRVALPIVAPDPPITRAKLPDWLRGDVIVEVTIDEQGNVVKTVVLQTVGYGLENTIIETLKRWQFTPAMIDGVKVASRQDVHFHFPS